MPDNATRRKKDSAKRKTLAWDMTEWQALMLEKHRFQDEKTDPLINRVLSRLKGDQKPAIAPVASTKQSRRSFRVDPDVENLVRDRSSEFSLSQLIDLALSLPVVGELRSADEALVLLREFEGQRLPAAQARALLAQRCSAARATIWLEELADRECIRLIHTRTYGDAPSPTRVEIGGDRYGEIFINPRCD